MPTQAWLTAAGQAATAANADANYEPILLADFTTLMRIFGTAAVASITVEYLLARLRDGGLGNIAWTLDEETYAPRLANASLALVNAENLVAGLDLPSFLNTPVTLKLGFTGLALADFETLFTGYVDRYAASWETASLSLVDRQVTQSVNLSTLCATYFPGTPAANRDRFIPVLLGNIINGPTIQVAGTAAGTLAVAVGTTETTIFLKEFNAPFPTTGTFTLEAETGITYTGRRIVNYFGKTYLELTGLTRGSPVSHAVGVAITLTSVAYVYLIGYEIATTFTLQTVRSNNVVVNPANYTLSVVQADKPVSVLTFTTSQGTVTVDIVPATPANLVANGGFETGDGTSWTTANGGSLAVGSTSPTAIEATYRAALTGRLGLYGDLYQDLTTVVGARYVWQVWHRNQISGQQIVNGGFETGTLSSWTTANNIRTTVSIISEPEILFYRGYEGRYLLKMAGDATGPPFSVDLYQEVTTVVGTRYELTFLVETELVLFQSSHLGFSSIRSEMFLSIGSSSSPTKVLNKERVSARRLIIVNPVWLLYPLQRRVFQFVATDTTTRFTFHVEGTNGATYKTWSETLGSVTVGQAASSAVLDNVVLRATSDGVDRSEAKIQLGTLASYTTYVDTPLEESYGWFKTTGTFTPTTTTTRLHLQSKYANTAYVTHFDAIRVMRYLASLGGVNPVEAIMYVLKTFLPDVPLDTTSFATAYTALDGWEFGGLLTDPGDALQLLSRMASQCKSVLSFSPDGTVSITVLDGSRALAATYTQKNIVRDGRGGAGFVRESAPMDALYSSVYVHFGTKETGGTNPSAFSGLIYVTPTDSSQNVPTTLQIYCDGALDRLGRAHRLDVSADFIQDYGTANLFLQWLVPRVTQRYDTLIFSTWLDGLARRLGELVQITHPRLPQAKKSWEGEIMGRVFDPRAMTVQLAVRLLEPVPTGSLIWASGDLLAPAVQFTHETITA